MSNNSTNNNQHNTYTTSEGASSAGGGHGSQVDLMSERMASKMNDATHYITYYAGKVQPHMKNVFRLLQTGQERLERQMQEDPNIRAKGQDHIAWRTWARMMISCQKRVHQSMQEMVSYLLEEPEHYCSHDFRILYYTNLMCVWQRQFCRIVTRVLVSLFCRQ